MQRRKDSTIALYYDTRLARAANEDENGWILF